MKSRSVATAAILRLAGAIFHYVWIPMSTYPWKLFRIIDPECPDADAEIQTFLDSCPLLYDEFASSFRAAFPTVARIKSAEAQALLWLMLLMIHLTIARIESRHAVIRRLLLPFGQTTGQDLLYTSVNFI